MKQFIINILAFFAIVFVIDLNIGFIGDYLKTNVKGGEAKRVNDLLNENHDIVILGSSCAHTEYDAPLLTRMLNEDVYNAGFNGNGVILSVGVLELILNRYTPKTIIFDVVPIYDIYVNEQDDDNKRYLGRLKPFYRERDISDIFWNISIEEWMKVQSGMMRYNTIIASLIADNIYDRGVEERGYLPNKGKKTEDRVVEQNQRDNIDGIKLQFVQKLIELSKEKNINLLFVASPKYGVNGSEELNPVKEICEEKGIPFLDYYADTRFVQHKELFKDPLHLNEKGAQLFTNIVGEDIKFSRIKCKL